MGNRRDTSRYPSVKKMAILYNVSLDDLIEFDADIREIEQAIERTSAEAESKIDWTAAWGKKYPILLQYQNEVNIPNYKVRLTEMLDELKKNMDTMILMPCWC